MRELCYSEKKMVVGSGGVNDIYAIANAALGNIGDLEFIVIGTYYNYGPPTYSIELSHPKFGSKTIDLPSLRRCFLS